MWDNDVQILTLKVYVQIPLKISPKHPGTLQHSKYVPQPHNILSVSKFRFVNRNYLNM